MQSSLICTLDKAGRAVGCRVVKGNNLNASCNASATTTPKEPSAMNVNWDEQDPVTFSNVTLAPVSAKVASAYPANIQPYLRVINGNRLCRGIYESIFINRPKGFTVPVMLTAAAPGDRYINARAFLRLMDTKRSEMDATPSMLVTVQLVNSAHDIRNGTSILSMASPITISFLGLYYENKRYIYNMNKDSLQTCFNLRQMPAFADLQASTAAVQVAASDLY